MFYQVHEQAKTIGDVGSQDCGYYQDSDQKEARGASIQLEMFFLDLGVRSKGVFSLDNSLRSTSIILLLTTRF